MDCKYVNSWVSQPDVCRCCLSARGSSDITISYVSDTGQRELYHEMLQVSFGISLSHLTEEYTSRMVCNLCVEQLKLAYAFKNQVLQSEKHFNLYYNAWAGHDSIQNVEETVKCKEPEINDEISQKDGHVIPEPKGANQHMILNSRKDQPVSLKSNSKVKLAQEKNISEECSVMSDYDSDTPIAKIMETISCQVNREIKSVKQADVTNESAMLNDGEVVGVIGDARPRPAKIRDIKYLSERKRVKTTCLTILRDTTACPFRHFKSWFRCFFCLTDFMEMQSLKEHTFKTHTNIDTELQKMKRYPRSLQIEISELVCKKCGIKMENVATLKNHLQYAHEEMIYSECIADYKIDAAPYSCHICGEQFHVFRTLTTHLNVHYANYICDVCGRPFLNTKRLKVHYRVHEKGTFPCNLCSKVLSTKSSRSNHMESAHSKRTLRCHVCQKPMRHYNARVKHMSEAHNITYNFKCPICGREYNVKHYLATHMRQSHGTKDKKCEECGMAFITSHGLKKHVRKHTGERPFSCPVCKKSYARGYTLKEHMRIHNSLQACTEKFNNSVKML